MKVKVLCVLAIWPIISHKCDSRHFSTKVRKSFLRVKMLNRQGQGSDPPPFRQCLYFGSFCSGHPSLRESHYMKSNPSQSRHFDWLNYLITACMHQYLFISLDGRKGNLISEVYICDGRLQKWTILTTTKIR